jgi:hypothetical protein
MKLNKTDVRKLLDTLRDSAMLIRALEREAKGVQPLLCPNSDVLAKIERQIIKLEAE